MVKSLVYKANIGAVTSSLTMDALLDVAVIVQLHLDGDSFFRNIAIAIVVVSSFVVGWVTALATEEQENIIVIWLLGVTRIQVLREAFKSIQGDEFITRGYGTAMYYRLKFFTAVSSSAPQAVVQCFLLLTKSGGAILQLSLFSALLSLTYIAYEKDHWFLQEQDTVNSRLYFYCSVLFRMCEVFSRVISLSLIAMILPWAWFTVVLVLDVLFVGTLFAVTQREAFMSDGVLAGHAVKSLVFMCAIYAPSALVIWPLALLETEEGLKTDVRIYVSGPIGRQVDSFL